MKTVFLRVAPLLVLVLALVLSLRAYRLTPPFEPADIPTQLSTVDESRVADLLSDLISIETVSLEGAPADTAAFVALHAILANSWPRLHSRLDRTVVGDLSLLYSWTGSDSSLPPMVLMAHLDVVPADTADSWSHPPFSGVQTGGHVWGRGALDDKGSVVALMAAVEGLLDVGFEPRRTIYLAFGHDEEIGGEFGAAQIARHLDAMGVRPAMVLDEGGFVVHDAVPGVEAPVAVVGIAEKGYANVRISAGASGGHSSVPPDSMAITRLAAALTDLHATPMPARLDGPAWDLFESTAPHMPLHYRLVFGNRWLFEPVLLNVLAGSASTNALIRTTAAFTVLQAGSKPNVLPDQASAIVNYRLLPGDTPEGVHAHVSSVLKKHDGVQLTELTEGRPASPVAPIDVPEFSLLAGAIRAALGADVVVAPYLSTGGTDAKHFTGLTDRVYRFIPFDLYPERDGVLLHGVDERVETAQLARAVGFYQTLLSAVAAP